MKKIPVFKREALFVAFAALLYLSLHAFGFSTDRFYHEEMDQAFHAVRMMDGLPAVSFSALELAGVSLPVNTNAYTGAILAYTYLPFFSLFGMTLAALRLPGILFGLGTVLLTYAFVRDLAGRPAATLATLLLALQPAFLMSGAVADYDIIMNLFTAAVLFAAGRWAVRRSAGWFYLLAFLLGLAFWFKIIFIWVIAGLAVSWAVWYRDELRTTVRQAALGGLLFVAGCLPLIYTNVVTGGSTVRLMVSSLERPVEKSGFVTDNRNVAGNLAVRWRQFSRVYGWHKLDEFYRRFAVPGARWFPLLFVGLSGAAFLLLSVRRGAEGRKRAGPLLVLFGVMFAGLSFTVSTLRGLHLLFLIPLPQIIVALGITELGRTSPGGAFPVVGAVRGAGAGALAAFLVVFNARAALLVLSGSGAYPKHGEQDNFDVRRIVDHLSARRVSKLYVFPDEQRLRLLGHGRVRVRKGCSDVSEPEFHVLRAAPGSGLPERAHILDGWKRTVDEYAPAAVETTTFSGPSGRPLYILYRMRKTKGV